MTRKQRRIANWLAVRTLIAAVFTLVTFVAIWVALDTSLYVGSETVLAIITAGLVADRLVATFVAPKRGRA